MLLSCTLHLAGEPVTHSPACSAQRGEDDDDALPFVSRPKQTVKVIRQQTDSTSTKAKATPIAGAVSTYNEMLDDDTEVEADDPGPETTLEGDGSIAFRVLSGRLLICVP